VSRAGYRPKRTPGGRVRGAVHPGRADDVIVLDNGKTASGLLSSQLKPRRPRILAAYRDEMERAHGI
jgi:hypothetical protein